MKLIDFFLLFQKKMRIISALNNYECDYVSLFSTYQEKLYQFPKWDQLRIFIKVHGEVAALLWADLFPAQPHHALLGVCVGRC